MTLNEELFEAVRCGLEQRIRQLVDGGADVNSLNDKGWTPLGIAIAGDQRPIAHILIELGARTDVRSPNGQDIAKMLAAA